MKRLGIFGGTFDPPHLAHLIAGEIAVEELKLDKLLFIPAKTAPNKIGQQISSAKDRMAMTQLATEGNEVFEVSSIELDRPAPSYTIDTLNELKTIHKIDSHFIFIGMDQFLALETWRNYEEIISENQVVVMKRPTVGGNSIKSPLRDRVQFLSIPLMEISSSNIRARVTSGKSIRYLVPEGVREYIEEHNLYRK